MVRNLANLSNKERDKKNLIPTVHGFHVSYNNLLKQTEMFEEHDKKKETDCHIETLSKKRAMLN